MGASCMESTTLPKVGDVVYGKVLRLHPQYAILQIACVAGNFVGDFVVQGKLRREDIRSDHIDAVVVADFVRPGDILKARVISLGDEHSYVLSTAAEDCGVCGI